MTPVLDSTCLGYESLEGRDRFLFSFMFHVAQSGVHEHLLNDWMGNVGVVSTITILSPSHTSAHTYPKKGLPMSITHDHIWLSQRPLDPILQMKTLRTREFKWLIQVIVTKNNIWLHLPITFTCIVYLHCKQVSSDIFSSVFLKIWTLERMFFGPICHFIFPEVGFYPLVT